MDAACYDEQSKQKHDEGYVVADDGLRQLFGGYLGAEPDDERNEKHGGPEHRNVQFMAFPPLFPNKREDGDGQKHADKGDDAPEWEQLTEFHKQRLLTL